MGIAHATDLRRNVIASIVGNVLEWYDFAIYGFLAPILGRQFFPADDPIASLLAAFGVFAIGCAARPLGGAIFGHVGDRLGRKPALIISVAAMGLATFSIGVLPSHAQLGSTATVLLVTLRIVQGLSVGGEFTGSVVFVGEHAPPAKRGLLASWPQFGCDAGFLLGSAIGALTSSVVGQAAMESWGWRAPFLLGGGIAVAGGLLRRHITEPAALLEIERARSPVRTAVGGHWRAMVRTIGLIMPGSVLFYTLFVYMESYLTEQAGFTTAQALDINTINLAFMMALVLPFAMLSDRIGRRPMIALFAFGLLLLSWPFWWLLHQEGFASVLLGELGFGVLMAVGFSALPATMIELFPTRIRSSGVSIGYNVCLGLFGGTAPLIAAFLVERTGDTFAPCYYLMVLAAVSLFAVAGLRETAGQPLA